MKIEAYVEEFLGEEVSQQAFLTPLSDKIAAEVVERLKQEADRYWDINPHRSLQFADRIVAIAQARGDARQIALGLMARGDALKFLGSTTEAWKALDQAGQMFQAAGDEVGWARTRIGRLHLSTMLQCAAEALAEAEIARGIFIRHGEDEKLLRLELQTGYVHNQIGNPLEALQQFQSSLSIAESLGEHGQHYFGLLFLNMGSAFEVLGEFRQAQDFYERARALFAAEGETLRLATVEANIGYLAQAQGNYRRGLRLLNSSLERAAGHSDLETTKIKWHLLECYLGLNRCIEARELAWQIVADCRQLNDSFELARVLLQLAVVEAELDNFEAAHASLDEAEGVFMAMEATTWIARTRLRRGRIALQRGDITTAREEAKEAAAVFESAGQHVNLATATLLQGQVLEAQGDLATAIVASTKALRSAQRDNVPSLRYSAHLLLGHIFEKQNALPRARRHYLAAAATVERVQRGLTITLRPGFLENKTDAWRALIGLHLRGGQVGNAFETLERAKSQVLLGYLANRETLLWEQEDAGKRELIEELNRLRIEHQRFYRRAHDSDHAPGYSPSIEPQHAIGEVKARERRMRAITEQLYLHSARDDIANSTQLPSIGDVQRTLDEGTLLVEYYNDGDHLWAFTLDRKSIDVHHLVVTPKVLNQLLAKLQLNLSAALKMRPHTPTANSLTHLIQRILQRLYSVLIEPLARHRDGRKRLVIVPYGALHYLPFHLLHDGSAYLIEQREVVILPAAGLAIQPSPKRKPGALILAHSWEGRLPNTHNEAKIVYQLFGGTMFTDQAARRTVFQAKPTQILHIAAHGQYRLDQPDFSYIQLADGQLYADDLLQQDLSYELVTLSACETGRANVAGGEELIGLGRGFLYAGAGALILSLWQVPDRSTLSLMEQMYLALRAGASKAAALRKAQMMALAGEAHVHPAFWGAFQLVGNPGPLSG